MKSGMKLLELGMEKEIKSSKYLETLCTNYKIELHVNIQSEHMKNFLQLLKLQVQNLKSSNYFKTLCVY